MYAKIRSTIAVAHVTVRLVLQDVTTLANGTPVNVLCVLLFAVVFLSALSLSS